MLFTITANKATTSWHQLMEEQVIDWKPWEYTEQELKAFERMKMLAPKVELGRIWWKPSWGDGKLMFPILIKRTWKSFCKLRDKKKTEQGGWDYYGVVTNFDLTLNSYQEVMVHHQKRASSENMNKEAKYGYRLNNFPCQSLVANQAWYCFAMIAHNLLRFVSLMKDPEHPRMTKKTRREFINFPSKVLERSKRLWLKVPEAFYKGVIKAREGWQFPEKVSAHMFSTA